MLIVSLQFIASIEVQEGQSQLTLDLFLVDVAGEVDLGVACDKLSEQVDMMDLHGQVESAGSSVTVAKRRVVEVTPYDPGLGLDLELVQDKVKLTSST
jgi:hypothetical protein